MVVDGVVTVGFFAVVVKGVVSGFVVFGFSDEPHAGSKSTPLSSKSAIVAAVKRFIASPLTDIGIQIISHLA